MLNNSTILITGGTGSFGHAFTKYALENLDIKKLIILSRDEMKQWNMAKLHKDDSRIRFFLGDIRDLERLHRAFKGVDYVVHAAATKIVPTAEYNPFECIKTNVTGGMNVIDAAIDQNVKKVVALSTDKASSPINLYGATKLISDKIFVAGNNYSSENGTKFSVVRYGNVMGSRGSVIPFFNAIKNQGYFPITDKRMTRFMITLEESVNLVTKAFSDMQGGEIYVKKIPSMNIIDIAKVINANCELRHVGIRPGEKLHEQMIGPEDAPFTYEYPEYFKILPQINNWNKDPMRIGDGKLVPDNFTYTSDKNDHWMSRPELTDWLTQNQNILGQI